LSKNRVVFDSLTHLKTFDSKWQNWIMPNGLRCLYIPLPKEDTRFQTTLIVGTGSRHESNDVAGISHLLEHMMFRGSERYPSFSDLSIAFESLGGEWNAATGHEYTEFYYNGIASHLDESIPLFADFILRPKLQELETERRIVQRELEGELNENGVSTDPDFHIATKIWPKTPMAQPIIGTVNSLSKIDQNKLQTWFKENYNPNNAVLCIVGGPLEEVKNLVNSHFGPWQNNRPRKTQTPVVTKFKGPLAFWVENSDNEYQVQMSFTCEGTGSQDTPCYELLTRVLADGFSSRLTRRIREELGLVYDISAHLHQYDGAGLINITASVLRQNLSPFFREVFSALNVLCKQEITSDELERHKLRAITDLEMTTAEPSALAWRGAWAVISGTEEKLSNWAEKFAQIDSNALATIANAIFKPESLCVVALGPDEDKIDQELRSIVDEWKR